MKRTSKKAKIVFSAKKHIITVFWGHKGDYLNTGKLATDQYYVDVVTHCEWSTMGCRLTDTF